MNLPLRRYTFWIVIVVSVIACGRYDKPVISGIGYKTLGSDTTITFSSDDTTVRVFMFMSPECPMCINYTKPYMELLTRSKNNTAHFYLVYPGSFYSEDEIMSFQSKYQLEGTAILDHDYKLTAKLKATITPQVIILNEAGEKVYTGAFDNWAYEPGRKRQVVTENYVEDALMKINLGLYPDPGKTEPIGCYIEE